jgi:hypothetical protein
MAGILANQFKLVKLLGNTVADTDQDEVTGNAIDARGFDRALFILQLGAVTATGTLTLNVQEGAEAAGDFVDIAGANLGESALVLTGKSDNEIFMDVPVNEGYLKVQYQRATANVEIDVLNVILYNPKKLPVADNSTLLKEVIV